jgi:hypothetical protein
MIDYAYPMMMAEKALKKAHDELLNKQYDAAIEELLIVAAEAKLAISSVKHMKEQSNAIRKQTKTVQERIPTAESARGTRKANGAATRTPSH